MSEFIPWLALVLWVAAVALRVHPQTRAWAPRGIAGGWAARSGASTPAPTVTGTPALPVPRDADDLALALITEPGDERPHRPVSSVREVSP